MQLILDKNVNDIPRNPNLATDLYCKKQQKAFIVYSS